MDIRAARSTALDGRLNEIAGLLQPGGDTRGVVVAGPTEEGARIGPAVVALAEATGWPLLADPLSGARYMRPGAAHVVAGYDLFLADPHIRDELAPTVILRVGATPTSASLQSWLLRHDGVPHVVIDAAGRWKDSGATATHYLQADPADALWRLADRARAVRPSAEAETADDPAAAWASRWRAAGEAVRSATAEAVSGHEGHIVASVAAALPPGGALVVSSSMPVRDLDAYGHPAAGPIDVFANRGASGIDGVVSTAYGVASQRDEPVVCVIGDVAFFHDRNGLLWSREPDAPVVFVLIDNDGGGIFHMLPVAGHEPHFTPHFATPHGIDARPVVESHGVDFVDATDEDLSDAVRGAVEAGRSAVIRIRTERAANHRLHTETREAVARAVRQSLTP